jgi:hypothetical protein
MKRQLRGCGPTRMEFRVNRWNGAPKMQNPIEMEHTTEMKKPMGVERRGYRSQLTYSIITVKTEKKRQK